MSKEILQSFRTDYFITGLATVYIFIFLLAMDCLEKDGYSPFYLNFEQKDL